MEKVLASIEAQEENIIAFLEKMVNIDSGRDAPEGNLQVAEMIGAKLMAMGFAVEYLKCNGFCTHVKGFKEGTGGKKVMVMGHLDTIQPKGSAKERPFVIKEGKAYGPGVLDMKGGIAVTLFALQALYEEGWGDKDVTVFFCGDEEHAHPHTNVAELFAKEAYGKDAIFNMETASAGHSALIGRKGNLYAELEIKGISAHAGADMEKGANAIIELAHKAIAISELTDFSKGLTCNVGAIEGGLISNAVPDCAKIKIDIRYLKEADRDDAIACLKKIAATTYIAGTATKIVNMQERFPPMIVTDGNKQLFNIVQAQGKKIGLDMVAKVGGGSSDAGWTACANVPSLCGMGAIGEFNHTTREYILVDSLVVRTKLLALSIDAL
ncbi:MAG: peptidase dimerization domain protein [Firmicutes bacterium]|nr:peptidase dimerization domain protein [Bacillota bacterium]